MFAPAAPLHVDENQRKRLQHLVKSGQTPQKVVLRARIVLMAGNGLANHAIAAQLKASRPTVILWRRRFSAAGVNGLMKDAPRPGRRKAIDAGVVKRVVDATLHTTPADATHWSVRSMAKTQGLSRIRAEKKNRTRVAVLRTRGHLAWR